MFSGAPVGPSHSVSSR